MTIARGAPYVRAEWRATTQKGPMTPIQLDHAGSKKAPTDNHRTMGRKGRAHTCENVQDPNAAGLLIDGIWEPSDPSTPHIAEAPRATDVPLREMRALAAMRLYLSIFSL